MNVFTCVCDSDVVMLRSTRACCFQCSSLFHADGGRREHAQREARGRLCVDSLLSLTGVIMPSSRVVVVNVPKSNERPEATPLTSRASCVLTVSFSRQSDSELPQGLATL